MKRDLRLRRLGHLSDLHLGKNAAIAGAAEQLQRQLREAAVDHVIVSGDVTHRGLESELRLFERIFHSFIDDGRLTVVPGNHDRLGDEVAARFMTNARVSVVERADLHLVCVDSTGPHNRSIFRGHGQLSLADLDDIDRALSLARPGALSVVAMHHHPLPLPEEHLSEHFSAFFGLPYACELESGAPLLARLDGRCDLVLHGHRHVPRALRMGSTSRPIGLYNAGSSTALGAFRLFEYGSRGLATEPRWCSADREVTESSHSALANAGRKAAT